MHRPLVAALVFLLSWTASAQQLPPTLSGVVSDAVTREPLAAATIRILGTPRGTISNAAGEFVLPLQPGHSTVIVSSLGYTPDTLLVDAQGPVARDIALTPSDIILPEVVVTSEDPAIGIIRKAIARKRQWIDRLATFSMEAFTRQVLRRDTAIASITESSTRGYWRAGDTLREVIMQRRQTANIKESFNFASVGVLLNFNEDRIRFIGYDFVGPTAEDALDYYDYKLLRTKAGNHGDVYDIAMFPRRRTAPLFKGTVSIAGDSYALVGVDVQPNEAFSIPFVREHQLRYRQEFSLYDSTFWMPADIRINGRFVIGFPGLTLPAIGFEQTSVVSSYAINVPVPDSVFHKPRVSVASLSAGRRDSSYWTSPSVLPLTPEEHSAYATLDSSQSLEMQFRPGGITATLGGNSKTLDALSYLDLTFNRVEGAHAGGRFQFDSIIPFAQFRGGFAYGFSSKTTSSLLGATLYTSATRTLGVGADWYRHYDHTQGWYPYNAFLNALTALFFKNDYYDYYRAEGWSANMIFAPSPSFSSRLTFTSEMQSDAPQTTNYSILYRSHWYRPNPTADEGQMRSLRLDLRLGRQNMPLDIVATNALGISIEHSSPSLASSDFSFTQYHFFGTAALPTFGRNFLFKPQLRLRLAAGTSTGTPPRQRYFSVETSSSGAAPFGAMRAMNVKEFTGVRYVAVSLEHNFRSIPFLALGIPLLYENGVELVVHGGAANAWGGVNVAPRPAGWYYEAGASLSRIFEILRVDGTWRLSSPGGFMVTAGIATLL